MSPFRLSSLVCLAFLLPLTCFAQDKPAPPTAPKSSITRTPAEELLDKSLDKLAKLRWLETTFTHSVYARDIPYEAGGKHIVSAPDKKVRYESHVTLGNAKGSMKLVCDGETIWRIVENGTRLDAKTYKLKELDAARGEIDRGQLGQERADQLIRDDDSEHGFLGVQPLLRELKDQLTFAKMESSVLPKDKPVYVLEGEWSKAWLDKLAPKKKEGASGVDPREAWVKRTGYLRTPRSCKLYLGRDNLWPYRIEWYGPIVAQGRDELLVRMDYAEPTLDKPSTGLDPALVFRPSEDEAKAATSLDPKLLIRARQDRILQLLRQEEQGTPEKSLLDPTAPVKRP